MARDLGVEVTFLGGQTGKKKRLATVSPWDPKGD